MPRGKEHAAPGDLGREDATRTRAARLQSSEPSTFRKHVRVIDHLNVRHDGQVAVCRRRPGRAAGRETMLSSGSRSRRSAIAGLRVHSAPAAPASRFLDAFADVATKARSPRRVPACGEAIVTRRCQVRPDPEQARRGQARPPMLWATMTGGQFCRVSERSRGGADVGRIIRSIRTQARDSRPQTGFRQAEAA